MNVNATPHYTIQEAAHTLGIGENELFAELRRRRVLDQRNVPTRRYKHRGYLIEQTGTYRHPVVGIKPYSRAYVTEAGMAWLRQMLIEDEAAQTSDARRDRLLAEIAAMNPDAGEIGAGKLAHIVTEARAIRAQTGAAS